MIPSQPSLSTIMLLALVLALSACGEDGAGDSPEGKAAAALGGFKQENTPENLKALMESIRETIHEKKDLAKANAIFRGLIPDAARFARAIKDDVEPAVRDGIVKMHSGLAEAAAKDDQGIATLCKPDQTVVMVHGATTEEIIQYKKDSVAFLEFPGGARQVAQQVLKPGMKFYQVEFLEPGKDAGMKYHLFYWDGKQWSMIGPAWRTFK